MRLEGLSVSNWACHPELEVDLSRGLQIEGRNGTGKSSILRAIRFAFASTAAGYKNRMIKNLERQAEITLSFTRDGKKYSINKVLHKDKPSTAQLTCEGELVADNPKNVSEALNDFLSEEVLDSLHYVPQGEITWIVDRLTQKGGRQELDSLFGLNRLEKAYKACGEKIREVKVKTEVFEEQLAKYPEDAEKEFREGLGGLSEEWGRLGIQIAEKNKVLGEVSGNLSEVERNISELKRRKVEREKIEVELGRLEIAISDVSNRIASFQREFNSLEGEKNELAELKSQASQCEKYAGLRKLLTEFTSLNDKLAQTKADEGESSRLRELELAVSGREEAGKTLIEFEKQFEKFNAALIESELEVQRLRAFLKDLRGLSGQANCPRCGQALSKGHLMNETVVTEQTIVKEEDRVGNIKSKEPEVRTFLDEAKARVKELQKMEFELKSLKDTIEKREGERVKVLKDREEISVKLKETGYDGEDPSLVEMKVSEYNNLKGKIEVVEEKLSGEAELKGKIEKLTKDSDINLARKKELSEGLEKIVFEPKELEEGENRRDGLFKSKYAIDGEVKELSFKLRENESKAREIEDKKKGFYEVKKSREESEAKLNLFLRAREVFHTDRGLPKYLRDKYINTLNATLTHYFKRFNQNPTYKEVSFDKDYKIQVKTTSGTLGLDQLSGGERVQLAVALRIALIEMLSPMRLLILDEPFGSLDEEHRELLGETLNKMAAGWQLILVTHVHVDSLYLESRELEGY